MSKVIHYDDNIFYAALLAKTLRQALALELDPDVYREKVLADLGFLDKVLSRFFGALRDNERLLERGDHFKNLLTVKKLFMELLDAILGGKTPFAQALEGERIALLAMKDRQSLDIGSVHGMMSQRGEAAGDIDVVSQDELSELFKVSEDGEEG